MRPKTSPGCLLDLSPDPGLVAGIRENGKRPAAYLHHGGERTVVPAAFFSLAAYLMDW